MTKRIYPNQGTHRLCSKGALGRLRENHFSRRLVLCAFAASWWGFTPLVWLISVSHRRHAWYHTSSNKRLVTPPTNQPIYVFLYRSSCSCCLPHNLSIDQLEPSNGEGSGVHKLGWRAQVVGGRSAKSNGAGSGVRKLTQLARVSCVDSSWPAALGQPSANTLRAPRVKVHETSFGDPCLLGWGACHGHDSTHLLRQPTHTNSESGTSGP